MLTDPENKNEHTRGTIKPLVTWVDDLLVVDDRTTPDERYSVNRSYRPNILSLRTVISSDKGTRYAY